MAVAGRHFYLETMVRTTVPGQIGFVEGERRAGICGDLVISCSFHGFPHLLTLQTHKRSLSAHPELSGLTTPAQMKEQKFMAPIFSGNGNRQRPTRDSRLSSSRLRVSSAGLKLAKTHWQVF